MHRVRAAAHGTEKGHADLARRHAAGHRRHRLRPEDLLSADGETLLAPSPVSVTLGGGEVLGSNPKVTGARKSTADARIASPFYKKSSVRDHYNELELTMRGDYGLVVRLYDDGLAYRFTTRKKDGILVENEQVAYTFPADYTAYAPYVGAQAAARFRRAVPQFVREHLHPSPADAARPPQTDLPARAGGTFPAAARW